MQEHSGILLVDKPLSWTSFDVVAKLRGALRHDTGVKKIKVGHGGTLDPLATGLLIVLVGQYCKRAQDFSGLDKRYVTTMKLGYVSETGDEEGKKRHQSDQVPTYNDVLAVARSFIGSYDQVPPAFSAKKVGGKRAYSLARRGEPVAIEPKRVTISQLEVTDYTYPYLTIDVTVSSGTYIRSLAEDIGVALECGAYVTQLRRTNIGSYCVEDARAVEVIARQPTQALLTDL